MSAPGKRGKKKSGADFRTAESDASESDERERLTDPASHLLLKRGAHDRDDTEVAVPHRTDGAAVWRWERKIARLLPRVIELKAAEPLERFQSFKEVRLQQKKKSRGGEKGEKISTAN